MGKIYLNLGTAKLTKISEKQTFYRKYFKLFDNKTENLSLRFSVSYKMCQKILHAFFDMGRKRVAWYLKNVYLCQ